MKSKDLVKITDWLWEIPKSFRADMRVPARIFATQILLEEIFRDRSLEQLLNVATLPGIQKYALAMPDVHEGYGFPVGGVAAFSKKDGIISPGGIGYDINCGVRLLRSKITRKELNKHTGNLSHTIFREVPSGVGVGGRLKLQGKEFDAILNQGAKRAVEMGYGNESDLENMESKGALLDADSDLVSDVAKKRGRDQLGTLGAGNHFIEVDYVEKIFDSAVAEKLGLFENQITILIHTGSRGLGHQIATDYIRLMMRAMPKYGISIPDRELACAPFESKEGQNYFRAMSAGANFAWANRQMITWEVRKAWRDVLGSGAGNLELVYDVAHNIAKIEEYDLQSPTAQSPAFPSHSIVKVRDSSKPDFSELIVHRKGATRAFPNQPVIIPGSMGTASYVLLGQEKSLTESFGSTCHGAGRRMSRTQAKKQVQGKDLRKQLEAQGIAVSSGSLRGLAEEAPLAYKDIDEVVDVIASAGIAKKVARLKPLAVIKG
ncbi:MAG: RtcB family protein [Candidatus Aminicenantes bacterium]|nr:RtcB family protein [Candidatus Aminicenantes bacterium]